MKKNENDIVNPAKAALRECLSKIPFLKVINVREEPGKTHNQPFDIKAKIKVTEGILNLIAEVKNSGQPRIAREAVNQILRYKEKVPDAYFVFIAPYISPKAAEICEAEGVGYLDLSGNCLLSFDKIFIQKENYPNLFKEKRDFKSLFATKSEKGGCLIASF